jgi:serine protease inhibitor
MRLSVWPEEEIGRAMQRPAAALRLTCMGITKLGITAGAAAVMITAAGCGSAPASQPSASQPPASQPSASQPPAVSRGVTASDLAGARAYGASDTAFGLDVLGAWCREDPAANIVLSPESLASGLGMAYLGARGSTARAMASVLHLPAADAAGATLDASLRARSAGLRGLDGPGVTVAGSDRVWAGPSLMPLRSYLNEVAAGYGATVGRAPLLTDPGRAVLQIDAAIAAATRGHIPQLLGPGSLDGVAWVLTDALYLNANWATPFQASQTRPGSFTTASRGQVSAQFLHGGDFRYTNSDGWTAVSLPYRGGKLTMTALLPDSGSGGCPALSAAALGSITSALTGPARDRPGTISELAPIALPKVSLHSSASLRDLLTSLGMGIAFTGDADFTGLSPSACCIGLVVHAATLAVAEKGTVASAATAVGVMPADAVAVPRGQIVFDRPYLLLVTATGTGEPLFLARVADPAAG